MASPSVSLKVKDIKVDWSQNPRIKHKEHISEIQEAIRGNESLPVIVVYLVEGEYRLAEGFHRIEAYKAENVESVKCEVVKGSVKDWKIACYASNRHQKALKRTREEKRKAVSMMVEAFPELSTREIAVAIDVSHQFVHLVRQEVEGKKAPPKSKESKRQASADKKPDERQPAADKKIKPREAPLDDEHKLQREPVDASNSKPEPSPDTVANEQESTPAQPLDTNSGTLSPVIESPEEIEPPEIVPTKAPPEVDKWGIPIQSHAVEAFASVPMFGVLIEQAKQLAMQFHRLAETDGGQFLQLPEVSSYRVKGKTKDGRVKGAWVHDGLDRFIAQLKAMTPYVTTCPYQHVDAPHPEKCSLCHGLGWVPKITSIPEELKQKIMGKYGVNIEE